MNSISEIEVMDRFINHPPVSSEVGHKLDILTQETISLGHLLRMTLPDCREASTAFTKLEETLMWAKKAIVRNQEEGVS